MTVRSVGASESNWRELLRASALAALVGAACGIASALFLVLLDHATALRRAHETLVYLLPAAGLLVGLAYERWGTSVRGGNDLVIDTVHGEDAARLPFRMAPFVLVGTLLTHVFGGSAGREGTAVQMGASLSDAIAHRFRATTATRRHLLAAGIAGGFGSVFGTPLAGAVFGVEVGALGRPQLRSILPALVAAFVGDLVTRTLGIAHTPYPLLGRVPVSLEVTAKLSAIGLAMGAAALLFIEATHRLKSLLARVVPRLPLRMMLGGAVVVVMWRAIGSSDYLGLGVPMIVRAYSDPTLPWFAFLAKLAFTTVTLSAGFLGGEVTPLFFVGATLGSVLARALGLPIELGAGVGIAAVFGAAANTPFALAIMATELLGANALPHVLLVTAIAYLVTGHRGIYAAQRVHRSKYGGPPLDRPIALRDWRDWQRRKR